MGKMASFWGLIKCADSMFTACPVFFFKEDWGKTALKEPAVQILGNIHGSRQSISDILQALKERIINSSIFLAKGGAGGGA